MFSSIGTHSVKRFSNFLKASWKVFTFFTMWPIFDMVVLSKISQMDRLVSNNRNQNQLLGFPPKKKCKKNQTTFHGKQRKSPLGYFLGKLSILKLAFRKPRASSTKLYKFVYVRPLGT